MMSTINDTSTSVFDGLSNQTTSPSITMTTTYSTSQDNSINSVSDISSTVELTESTILDTSSTSFVTTSTPFSTLTSTALPTVEPMSSSTDGFSVVSTNNTTISTDTTTQVVSSSNDFSGGDTTISITPPQTIVGSDSHTGNITAASTTTASTRIAIQHTSIGVTTKPDVGSNTTSTITMMTSSEISNNNSTEQPTTISNRSTASDGNSTEQPTTISNRSTASDGSRTPGFDGSRAPELYSTTSTSSSSFSSSAAASSSSSSSSSSTFQVSSSPVDMSSSADLSSEFQAERSRLNGKIDDLNNTIKSLTIALAIVSAVLFIVIAMVIIYKVIKFLRRKESAMPIVMDAVDDKKLKRDQKSYFRPQSTYDFIEKNDNQCNTSFSNETSLGKDEELVTFNLSGVTGSDHAQSAEDGDFTGSKNPDSENKYGSTDKTDTTSRDSLSDNAWLSGGSSKGGSSFVDVNLT